MDGRGWQWVYEPFCYASPDGQYLPDFMVSARDAEYFIEIKPTDESFTDAWLAKGDIIRASKPDARFGIVVPGGASRWHAEWRLHTRESCVGLVEWVTGTPDLVECAEPPQPAIGSRFWIPESVEVAALLVAIHAPDAFGTLMTSDVEFGSSLFAEVVNRTAFVAQATGSCSDPATRELLEQLDRADIDGEPEDAISGLVRESARRMMRASPASPPLEIHQALMDVNEPKTQVAATGVLMAWLKAQAVG
jgi:hypothetical protein